MEVEKLLTSMTKEQAKKLTENDILGLINKYYQ